MCTKNQRCNNVIGCIDIYQTSTETSNAGSSAIFKVTTVNSIFTNSYGGYSEPIETSNASTYLFMNASEPVTTTYRNREGQTHNTHVKSNNEGLLEREILIYSLCAAGFIICIVVCVACFCCKTLKRRKTVDISVREQKKENVDIHDHNVPGIYDFIDEDDMLQLSPIAKTRSESIRSSNSYSFTVSTHSDGYLDPISSIKISHSDTSTSDPDIKNENSSYIHHYQTISHQPVALSHEYTRCIGVPYLELVDFGRSRTNGINSNGGFQRRQTKIKHNLNNKMNIQKYHQSESDITNCSKGPCPSKKFRSSY
ncbi:uncharacterized protein [Mytilus edulis]|uniref:uncharacterized protein n=1 Tax=Mytilus edulis TaxID=6550 RepID=UPI0039F0C654